MVVIRLARGGRVKQAIYRIVAADKRRSATSKFLDVLGTYNPHTKELKLDKELTEKWSQKYKRSIDCEHPKGFSQRAHCQGRKKRK